MNSHKQALLILVITSLVCSRTLFFFIDDPEGPNLLIVTVLAAVIYFVSLAAYLYNPIAKSSFNELSVGRKGFIQVLLFQVLTGVIFYFGLGLI